MAAGTVNAETHRSRRRFAGTVAAGSVFAAVSAGIVAIWSVVDCVRFQTGPGQCDETMGASAPTFVAAVAAVAAAAGGWGMGYETLNPSLESRRPRRRSIPRRGPDGKFLPSQPEA